MSGRLDYDVRQFGLPDYDLLSRDRPHIDPKDALTFAINAVEKNPLARSQMTELELDSLVAQHHGTFAHREQPGEIWEFYQAVLVILFNKHLQQGPEYTGPGWGFLLDDNKNAPKQRVVNLTVYLRYIDPALGYCRQVRDPYLHRLHK